MDILTVDRGIIVHQVNLMGVMGRGLALDIKNKWPNVYAAYKQAVARRRLHLGDIQVVFVRECNRVRSDLAVCNLAGQIEYGTGECYTDYQALAKGLEKLGMMQDGLELPIYFPYGMGCGLGGGDWNVVSELIFRYIPDAIICRKEQ